MTDAKPKVRKGQAPRPLSRAAFGERFRMAYDDPSFDAEKDAIGRIEEIAGHAYYDTLDRDQALQEETRNVAHAVAHAVGELRAGRLSQPDRDLERRRPK